MATPNEENDISNKKPFNDGPPKRYSYQALDIWSQQIRLIKLRPGRREPLHCHMEVFNLLDAPSFTALSYTWGPVSPTFDILVNKKSVTVRKGLFRFLQAYDGAEYLWIDQICIDQSNILERNHQVSLMAKIYSQCCSVIVWLGRFQVRPRSPIIFNNTNSPEALAMILQHEYFKRIWIVQEVLLARRVDVLCSHASIGNVWVSWDAMRNVVRHSVDALNLFNVPTRPILLLQEYGSDFRRNLTTILSLFSKAHCQDPRDRVYGLMGLVEEEQRLIIDYGKPLQEVLLDVMRMTYEKFGEISYESYETIGDLGLSMGITSDSFRAFLHDIWLMDLFKQDSTIEVSAMGYISDARRQSLVLLNEELVPYRKPDPPHLTKESSRKPDEAVAAKDCWWYDIDGITYQVYGLMKPASPPEERTVLGWYGVRTTRSRYGQKTRKTYEGLKDDADQPKTIWRTTQN